tara:strand:+ start:4407 stop:4922 length:516 start_codon:yes stop_codon:yes gene_type:complete
MTMRDKSRSLFWNKGSRPKTSHKVGNPNPKEGSEGDIQIRQTNFGTRFFSKLGGRWFSNLLYDDIIDNPDVYLPKVWSKDFTIASTASNSPLGSIPNFIKPENIVSFTANIWSDSIDAMWAAGDHTYGGTAPLSEAQTIGVFYILNTGVIYQSQVGATMQGAEVKITVFFK